MEDSPLFLRASDGRVEPVDGNLRWLLGRRLSLRLNKATVKEALTEVTRQAGLSLAYSDDALPPDARISVQADGITLAAALTVVLSNIGFDVVFSADGQATLVKQPQRPLQVGTLGGYVRDSLTARPLGAVVVTIDGSPLRATTTDGGFYFFSSVPVGRHRVRARRIGYRPAELPVAIRDSVATEVDFLLSPSATQLDAVLVTATGPRRRLDVGSDVTILNADSLVRSEPISSVTQMLEGRIPGLEVVHTSGIPGDPSRLRLRGTSSAFSSNDPIVIVDGVRIFAAQSDSQSGNLARSNLFRGNGGIIAAPSALDQIDPNTIETVEVFKGPSAATMYGADAANGVIVLTTKRGRPGPTRWTIGSSRATTFMPGQYPVGTYRFGTDASGARVLCPLTDFSCRADSVVHFQALNEPPYTILGRGNATQFTLDVSGGVGALTYSVTGSADEETGLLKLPSLEAEQYAAQQGAPPPAWMQRPDHLSRWSGGSRLSVKLNDRTDVSLLMSLTRETQQRSDLEGQIATLMTTYVDRDSLTFWRGANASDFTPSNVLLPAFYTRVTDQATNVLTGANLTWQPLNWLNVSADAGLNTIARTDQVFLPHGVLAATDTGGDLTDAHGSTLVSTVNLRATAALALPLGLGFQMAAGANYTKTSKADLSIEANNLVAGTASINGAGRIANPIETANDVASFGWYLEPTIKHGLLSISTGLRIDGSSGFGTHVTLPAPKFGVSYLISEEPWFPFKSLFDVLRVRAAYGLAGVWPGPTQQLRLYQPSEPWLGGGYVSATTVSDLGNTRIKPERSTEWEGGVDADVLREHLSVGFSAYSKLRRDALMQLPVAPSVYGGAVSIFKNIGEVRNTGLEISLTAQLVRSSVLAWSAQVSLSQNHNLVVQLGPGVTPFDIGPAGRVAPGYPLFGYWALPILAYYDANHDGIIEASEVRLGDTAVYMGSSEPKYQASASSTVSLFRGAISVTADLTYQHAFTQLNIAQGPSFLLPSFADPSAAQSAQAAAAVRQQTPYGLFETVSVLRLNALSLAYNAPRWLADRMGARAVSLQLQGTNLGLWTSYRGKDPNVNAFATGNSVYDSAVLPLPRTWLLSIRAAY